MAAKYEIGQTYDTPKGKVLILARTPKHYENGQMKHPRVTLKVLETGTILNVQTTNIATGKFNDYRRPTVYNIGYIGSDIKIPSRGTFIRRAYDLWANMLKRAYGEYKGKYKNVTVDKRWHNFTAFLNSLPLLENYDKWERGEPYSLDKDTKIKGNRQYSQDTCRFILCTENSSNGANSRWHGINDPALT